MPIFGEATKLRYLAATPPDSLFLRRVIQVVR